VQTALAESDSESRKYTGRERLASVNCRAADESIYWLAAAPSAIEARAVNFQ